ncbi:MAG: hypothetical protein QXR17_07810 [Candidatus Bathyarchaeia archaeon]
MEGALYAMFKQQLLDYMENLGKPVFFQQLLQNCNQWISPSTLYNALSELEEEEKIVRFSDGSYATASIALKKWIRKLYIEIEIPTELYNEVKNFIQQTKLYNTAEDFIKEALKHLIPQKKPSQINH